MLTVNGLQVIYCDTTAEYQAVLAEAQAARAEQSALSVSGDPERLAVTVTVTGLRLPSPAVPA